MRTKRASSASNFSSPLTIQSILLLIVCAAIVLGSAAMAQEAAQPVTVSRPLITQPIDETQLTTLKGNTHPLARPQFDLGTAPATLPMERMLLVLKRSPEQEYALRTLLDNQQDKGSPSYHKWLTPEQYGKQFGPTDDDMQKITAWLQSHGFQVGTTKGRAVLEFSGSASQVQEAFHTTIHKYIVNGGQHWANSSDPKIPTALTPAVAGVASLYNFPKRPQYRLSKTKGTIIREPGKPPQVNFTDGSHGLGPADYAVIYNINPVYNTMNVNGSGITIGVVGDSDILLSDVSDFQNFYGLPTPTPNVIINGPDPGNNGDDIEGTLDVTWSQSIAPGATVDFVISGSSNATFGTDLSALYIVENNLANVMTESFGICEAGAPDGEFTLSLAIGEQAAAQGITFMASTGDAGAEGCDNPNFETIATGPISVSLPASAPFTVAVGGTELNEGGNPATYWTSNNGANNLSAISYIPEVVWNDSCPASSCGANANIAAGGGGSSAGNGLSGGTTGAFGKPPWQAGFGDSVRDVPDVSLTASLHDGYTLCFQGSCAAGGIYLIGGTSASAPSFAAIMALVDQRMGQIDPTSGSRQGLANYVLYPLFTNEASILSTCNASATPLPAAACTFNDVTSGNNEVPGEQGYPSGPYTSATGYDEASGLGSVNVANLITNWASATFRATTTSLTINGSGSGNGTAVSLTHGNPATIAISVTASSGPATPTPAGDVSLIAATGPTGSPTNQTGVAGFTLTGGTFSGTTTDLPGGSYRVTAHYAGNSTSTSTGTFAPSDSASPGVLVKVSAENSTTTLSLSATDINGNPVSNPYAFGSIIFVQANVNGSSGQGVATGPVTFADTFGALPSINPQVSPPVSVPNPSPLNSQGNTSIGDGIISFDAGNHSITATYGGDASFNATPSGTTSNSVSFTVNPGFAIVSGFAPVTIAAPGASGMTTVGIVTSTGFSSVSFTCTGLPAEATCSPASATGQGPTTVVNTTITVNTTAPHMTMLRSQQQNYYAMIFGGGFPLAGIVFLAVPRRRKSRKMFGTMLGLMIVAMLLLFAPACGGGGGGGGSHTTDPGTPAGNYTVTITASATGAPSESGQFFLTVQ